VTRDYPSVQVRDQAEYRQQQADQVNQLLTLFYALLVLAIVIAFLGIVNTLALSVLERVREIGLLRALGMTRRQLRAMMRWEAVIIALLGAILGLAIGIFLGWTLVRALHSQGVTAFSLPILTLLSFVGLRRHQRLGERLDHQPQRVRVHSGELPLELLTCGHTGKDGHRVFLLQDLQSISKDHPMAVSRTGDTPIRATPYTTSLDATSLTGPAACHSGAKWGALFDMPWPRISRKRPVTWDFSQVTGLFSWSG